MCLWFLNIVVLEKFVELMWWRVDRISMKWLIVFFSLVNLLEISSECIVLILLILVLKVVFLFMIIFFGLVVGVVVVNLLFILRRWCKILEVFLLICKVWFVM